MVVRGLTSLGLGSWFRIHATGAEHVPEHGLAIVAANHKSFLDAFFVGLSIRRRVHFMAKSELFREAFGWLLVRLGAFPVRRGEGDAFALETARAILDAGGVLVVFPEGTRVDEPERSGRPTMGPDGWRVRPARRSCRPRSSAPRTFGSARSQSRGASTSRSCRRWRRASRS
jgi:1-acyl-sn-glycerol-3-phosphate acyltransferase